MWIDTDKKKATGWVKLDGGASLIGIDVRPADGKLYGVTPDGAIVIVDHKTGKWEKKSQLSEALPKGATFTVDFNPVADRLRILSSTGMSYRINVEDGKTTVDGSLKYAEADANKGKQPTVTAGAYSNSFAGTKETALYDIDAANGTFVRQAPPNDGILNTLGKLGTKVNGDVAFDIVADGKGGNTGWMLIGGTLYTVDIATGSDQVGRQDRGPDRQGQRHRCSPGDVGSASAGRTARIRRPVPRVSATREGPRHAPPGPVQRAAAAADERGDPGARAHPGGCGGGRIGTRHRRYACRAAARQRQPRALPVGPACWRSVSASGARCRGSRRRAPVSAC